MRRRVWLAAAAVALVVSGCTSSGKPEGSPSSGAQSGVGSYNAPGVQPVETEPCPTGADLLPAPAAGRDVLPAVELECIGAAGSSLRVPMARIGGRPTVVNLWASWCRPCVKEMPDLQKAHVAAGDKVRFLGVDTNDPVGPARARIVASGITYPSVADPDERVRKAVGSTAMPTTLFVDAAGQIKHRQFGPMSEQLLRELIGTHLGVQL